MARAFLEDIPQARFTDATIRRMYELVDRAKTDEKFQKLIYGVVNRAMRGRWKEYRQEIETLLQWLKEHVDYRRDPYNVELVQDVWATLDRKRGDCDDMATLMAGGAEVLGAPARFVTVSNRPNGQPSHVFLEVMVDGQWMPVDPIVQESFVGWEPQGVTARKVWSRKALGLSGYDPDEPVEGLGMNNQSMPEGWVYDQYNVTSRPGGAPRWEGGFASRMHSVNLTPYPDDISATFAPGVPGGEVIMRRRIPGALIAKTADGRQMERPGGGVYAPHYPIMARETPELVFQTVPYKDVPMVLDPNVWTGSVPDAVVDPNAMLPQQAVTEEGMLTDLAGIGIDAGRLSHGERRKLHREFQQCRRAARQAYREAIREAKGKRHAALQACRLNGLGDSYLTYRELEPQAPIMGEYMDTLMGEYDENFYADYTLIGEYGVEAFDDEDDADMDGLGIFKKAVRHHRNVARKARGYHKKAKSHIPGHEIREKVHERVKPPGLFRDSDTDTSGRQILRAHPGRGRGHHWGWGRGRGNPFMSGLGDDSPLMGGLMSDVTKIVGTITETVTAGVIKKDDVNKVVDYAVDWYAEKRGLTPGTATPQPPAYQPPPPKLPTTQQAGVGVGTIAAVGAVLYFVTKKKGRRRR